MHGCPEKIPRTIICTILAVFLLIGTASAAAPTAAFTGTPTSGAALLATVFTDRLTGGPTGWVWLFGDETYEEA